MRSKLNMGDCIFQKDLSIKGTKNKIAMLVKKVSRIKKESHSRFNKILKIHYKFKEYSLLRTLFLSIDYKSRDFQLSKQIVGQ